MTDLALNQHFKDPTLFVFKRGPNLHSRLVRADILPHPKQSLLAPVRVTSPVATVL